MKLVVLFAVILLATPAYCFMTNGKLPTLRSGLRRSSNSPALNLRMGIEQIEYIIHRDGRVEEKVTGVKGQECHEVTKEVEKALGKVVHTAPTSEQFEQKATVVNVEAVKENVQKW